MNIVEGQVWRNKNNAKRLRVEFPGLELIHVINVETRKTALIAKKDLVTSFELEK
jgi:hypothetical protein